jgi:hypothetical protein
VLGRADRLARVSGQARHAYFLWTSANPTYSKLSNNNSKLSNNNSKLSI